MKMMGTIETIQQSTIYRVSTEQQAIDLITEARDNQNKEGYTVKEGKYRLKQKKSKGEVIEECFLVTITKSFE